MSTRFNHGQTRRSTCKIVRYAENRLKASGGHGLCFPTTCHESRNTCMYFSLHEKMPDNAINSYLRHASNLTNRKIVGEKELERTYEIRWKTLPIRISREEIKPSLKIYISIRGTFSKPCTKGGGGGRNDKITILSVYFFLFFLFEGRRKIPFEISRSRQIVVVDRGLENSSIIRLPARGRYSAMIRDDNIDVTLSTWNLER